MKILTVLFWLGLSLGSTSYAADNVVSVTRLVMVFNTLEAELDVAAQHNNVEVINKLLAPNFEMRVGAMPGNPVPRAAWLHQLQTVPSAPLIPEQMAVHDYDNVAVVSFLNKRSTSAGDIYIVDVWKKLALSWQLAVRYASPAGRADFVIPGAALNEPVLDKRY
ncbi:DUF4440 domain-containing protein [Sulfuriferula nivalis]|uniref:DUF4440 domain-containing protein n=1 Tax=Sulfuriferula nivalis TaxID=2675298 RepID=A0A809S7N1_9PROT|nr:DUF4440 domain-containing protein [Sulfuriferula nivalis]BBO99902.1 hypothetical protein SFSGTM_06110 [Sulfuriferula nivalis]